MLALRLRLLTGKRMRVTQSALMTSFALEIHLSSSSFPPPFFSRRLAWLLAQPKRGSAFRKFFLAIYVMGVAAIAGAVVLVILEQIG